MSSLTNLGGMLDVEGREHARLRIEAAEKDEERSLYRASQGRRWPWRPHKHVRHKKKGPKKRKKKTVFCGECIKSCHTLTRTHTPHERSTAEQRVAHGMCGVCAAGFPASQCLGCFSCVAQNAYARVYERRV